jgi:hypothetical protein
MFKKLLLAILILSFAGSVHAANIISSEGMQDSNGIPAFAGFDDSTVSIIRGSYEAATTSDTLLISESGKTISVTCATPCEFELPPAVAGANFMFTSSNTVKFSVDPNGTDVMYAPVGAVPLDAGDKVTSPGTTGDTLGIFSTADGYWNVIAEIGAFTDGGQ